MRWGLGGLFAVGALYFTFSGAVPLAAVYGAFALLIVVLYPKWTPFRYRSFNRRLYQNARSTHFGRCQLTLDCDVSATSSQAGESRINLSAVDRVESGVDHISFMWVLSKRSLSPKRKIKSGEPRDP